MKLIIERGPFSFLIGIIAFLLVFITNLAINALETAFYRGAIAFITFLMVGYITHLFVAFFLKDEANKDDEKNRVNLVSEAEDMNLNEIYQTSKEEDFQPLEFEQINQKKK